MRLKRWASAVLLAAAVLAVAAPSVGKQRAVKNLPVQYREWLDEVELLITKEEKRAFLELEKDYQRDAFVRRFWEAREPTRESGLPGFKERFLARREEALSLFGKGDDRYRIYALNGEAGEIVETDCGLVLWPIQFWTYRYSEHVGSAFVAIFYQSNGAGPFRLFRPSEGYGVLIAQNRRQSFRELIAMDCAEESDFAQELLRRFEMYELGGSQGPVDAEAAPKVHDPEWLETFHAFSTDAEPSAEKLACELEFQFSGRHQSRVIVHGNLVVPRSEAGFADLGGERSANFLLTGEVLRGEELFESFRYRFDVPERGDTDTPIPLVFERYLRPGQYRIVIKLDDLNGAGSFREEIDLEVPPLGAVVEAASVESEADPEEDLAAAPATAGIELVSEGTELRSGLTRFSLRTTGEGIAKVRFLLDEQPVLTKNRPPYSVELNLGSLPVSHSVRAVAYGAAGREIATDEVLINPGEHSFSVRLIEPRQGERYSGTITARAEVQVPEDNSVERVEVFLNEDRVATLFQQPYVQPVTLADDELAFLRVVAFLEDGNSTEDLVVFNSAQYLEDVSVRLMELYATVLDRGGRPMKELGRDAFKVYENGAQQDLVRFERLDDLPIYAGLLVDTSASMAPNLKEVQRVALGFFKETIRSQDRAAVITFSDHPRLAASFTNDTTVLAGALAGLTAERSTALYDSVMFGLYYFKGIKGQRTLIVLSDGQDRRSEATFDQTLDFARSTGVTIYTIGLELDKAGRNARSRLSRLAEETGGRSFFMKSVAELEGICEIIQGDLRSRYLLAYYPTEAESGAFRTVDVKVAQPGAEVRTLRGYYPSSVR